MKDNADIVASGIMTSAWFAPVGTPLPDDMNVAPGPPWRRLDDVEPRRDPAGTSYEDYLRTVRAQEERDRGRFMGTAPAAPDEQVYDARSGSAMRMAGDPEPCPFCGDPHVAPPSPQPAWTVRTWRPEDREEAGDLWEPHRQHPHAVDTTGPAHWNQSAAKMECRICRTLDVFIDGMMMVACYEHGPSPRVRVFAGHEKPPSCPEPHN